jgi:hypothetical protein
MRASDGFRPGASSSGDKPHHLKGNMAKEVQKEDLLDLAQNQWIAIELKMKQQKFKMLSAENCKDKDLAYNRKKVTIIYYFKEDRLGWLQGRVHAKTQGKEAQDFNWICDFSKELRAFRLDDDLYVKNKGNFTEFYHRYLYNYVIITSFIKCISIKVVVIVSFALFTSFTVDRIFLFIIYSHKKSDSMMIIIQDIISI